MDQRSKEMLKGILEKDIQALDEKDVAFLRARRSYLTASEVEKYAAVLVTAERPKANEKSPVEVPEEVAEVAPKKVRKYKKK